MTKMRLTTLNLDDECLKVLGGHKNKSKYAREAIKGYATAQDDADYHEEQYVHVLKMFDDLVKALVQHGNGLGVMTLEEFFAEYLDVSLTTVHTIIATNAIDGAIRQEAYRHARP